MSEDALIAELQRRGMLPGAAPDDGLLAELHRRGLMGQEAQPAPATVGEPGEVGDPQYSVARYGAGIHQATEPELVALQQQQALSSDPVQGMQDVLSDLDPDLMVYEDDHGPFVVQPTKEGDRKFYFNKEGLSRTDYAPLVGAAVVGGPAQKGAAIGKALGRVGQFLGLTGGAVVGSTIRQKMAGDEVTLKDTGFDVGSEVLGSGAGRMAAALGRKAGQKLGIESLENAARSDIPQGELDQRAVAGARGEAEAGRQGIKEAYQAVGVAEVSDQVLREELGHVSQVLRQSDVLVSDNTPAAKQALEALQDSLSGAPQGNVQWKLNALEDYRRKLFVNVSPANGQDARALGVLRGHYDDSVMRAGVEALGEGNIEAIEQLTKARGMRAKFGRMFEDPKAVAMVVKPETLADGPIVADEVMQRLMGVSAVSNSGSARMAHQIRASVSPETWGAMKQSFLSRLFRGKDGQQLAPKKMVTKVRELLNAKTGLNDIMLSAADRKTLQRVAATDPLNISDALHELPMGSLLGSMLDPYTRVGLNEGAGSAVGGLLGVAAERQVTPENEEELAALLQQDHLSRLMGNAPQ